MGTTANLEFSSKVLADNIKLEWKGYNDTINTFVNGLLEQLNAMKNEDV